MVIVYSCTKKGNELDETQNPITKNTSEEPLEIGDIYGNVSVSLELMLDAFNETYPETATEVFLAKSNESDFGLFFRYSETTAVSFILESKEGKTYLKSSNLIQEHSCNGDPCNSCMLKMFGPLLNVACQCLQACVGCQCNHTVTQKMSEISSATLIKAYNKLI